MDARVARIQINQDDVIEELRRVALSNMKDFASWDNKTVTFKTSEELPDDIASAISEISQTETLRGSQIKLKLHDKIKSLELLAKHLGMMNQKVDVKDSDGNITSITINL
jgi:phage terminase small subunit